MIVFDCHLTFITDLIDLITFGYLTFFLVDLNHSYNSLLLYICVLMLYILILYINNLRHQGKKWGLRISIEVLVSLFL